MNVKTPTLVKNEIKMLYNQFVRTITTPSMLGFYLITVSGALFVSSIAATLFNLAPLFSPLTILLESTIDRYTIFTTIGLLTLGSIAGGYFGIGPAEVLDSPDEYIMMVGPVHPHQLFLGRYIRRIARKFYYIVLGLIVVFPLVSQSGLLASGIMLAILSIIVFLEVNYFLGGICSIVRNKIDQKYTSRWRYFALPIIVALAYIPSLPLATWHPIFQLGIPANQMSLLLMQLTGIHSPGIDPLIVFVLLLVSFFISLLVISNISDTDYYELFSSNKSKEEAEGSFSRRVRGQVD
ncbi:MAG: hypothetical protein ACW98Y_19910, partial [Candidatus Thorarchaeota archaeon]